jgi:hypothetical protein
MFEIRTYSFPNTPVAGAVVSIDEQSWYRYDRDASPLLVGVSALNYKSYSNSNVELVAYNAYFTLGVGGTSFLIDLGLYGTYTFLSTSLDNYHTTLFLGAINAVQAPNDYELVSAFETARGNSIAIIATSASTGANILLLRTRTDPARHYDHHHLIHDNFHHHGHHHGHHHSHHHGHHHGHSHN